jgi:ketosteroid isomerase-like protein
MAAVSPNATIERLQRAMNARDIDAFVDCFDPAYVSEQPLHPDRAFGGVEQVRTNWSSLFEALPDFRAELRATALHGDTAWSEWHWTATRADGEVFDWRGVIIMGIRDARITWARLYMEPTEFTGAGIDAAVRDMREG